MRYLIPLLLLAAVACSDGTSPPPVPSEIRLSEPAVSMRDGDTLRITATVLDQNGAVLSSLPGGASLTWTSSAPAIVSVRDGLLSAFRPGGASVSAQVGSALQSVEVVVRPVPRATVRAGGDGQRGTVGTTLTDSLAVRVIDRHGDGVPGTSVSFRVGEGGGGISTAAAVTGADGIARTAWTLGLRSGEQSATAEVAELPGSTVTFRATASAGAPAALRAVSGDEQTAPAGSRVPAPLVVRVLDAHGNAAAGAEVAWAVASGGGTISPARAATESDGAARATWVLGSAGERQTATASLGGVPAVTFAATARSPENPFVAGVEPAALTPGATATITGGNFGASAGENVVTIAGVTAPVVEASPSRLVVRVPARSVLPCDPSGSASVVVSVSGRTGSRAHPLRMAVDRALAVGQSLSLRTPEDVRCNRLSAGGGRYLVSVFNTGTSPSASTAFELRGGAGGASTSRISTSSAAALPSRGSVPAALQPLAAESGDAHLAILEANRRLAASLAPRLRLQSGSGAGRALLAASPKPGDTVAFRIPSLDSSSLCSSFTELRARAVYAGRHAVVFEDLAAPLAGQMDSLYQALGQEYDGSMHPVVLNNFGNPLAVDAQTDANGRLFMLFTKVVNDSRQNVAGFVFAGDLFRRADCAASNSAEIFYARVPTSLASGFSSNETRDAWFRSIRATVVHEVKHLASYAERLAASARTWEESWLEESTARISEELWARGIFGYAQRGNAGYRQSIHCEVRPTVAGCVGRPLVMLDHFDGLHDYAVAAGARTPLGRTSSSDASFYGSGWALVRWAIDHASTSESDFLRTLTREPNLSGFRNLEARTGRSFADLLADWSLALAADDRSGFTPARPQLTFPSWNLGDVFAGMSRDFPNYWSNPDPLTVRKLGGASFGVDVPALRGGSAVVFEVAGDGSVPPVLGILGPGGSASAATLGVAIVRVQ